MQTKTHTQSESAEGQLRQLWGGWCFQGSPILPPSKLGVSVLVKVFKLACCGTVVGADCVTWVYQGTCAECKRFACRPTWRQCNRFLTSSVPLCFRLPPSSLWDRY